MKFIDLLGILELGRFGGACKVSKLQSTPEAC